MNDIDFIKSLIFNSYSTSKIKTVEPFFELFNSSNTFQENGNYIYYGVINNVGNVDFYLNGQKLTFTNVNHPILFDKATGNFTFTGYIINIEKSPINLYTEELTLPFSEYITSVTGDFEIQTPTNKYLTKIEIETLENLTTTISINDVDLSTVNLESENFNLIDLNYTLNEVSTLKITNLLTNTTIKVYYEEIPL